MLPDETEEEDSESFIMWTQIISKERPKLTCSLGANGQKIILKGTIDTRVDVTVISTSKWPPEWALVSPSGVLTGIRGESNS